jgi:phosphoribosylamine--glycine ligase
MKVLIVGSGGREHALACSVSKSKRVEKIYAAPGNAGLAALAECVNIKAEDIPGLLKFALENEIGLTVVGGETSLALGIVDEFAARGLRVFGPPKAAAALEFSKVFAKEFMARHGIPTADFSVARSFTEAEAILNSGKFGAGNDPVVVKADGLAAGKGVVVAQDRSEAVAALKAMMLEGTVGKDAAEKVVLEETLAGRELSLLFFTDGNDYALMPPARDHKRIGEGDTGPNTGGMGVITDGKLLTADDLALIEEKMIRPTLTGAAAEGLPIRGVVFLGLMMTSDGPKLLEYNMRFGDPETQSILLRLETDIIDVMEATINDDVASQNLQWSPGNSACVILAAKGYPGKPETGAVIAGLDQPPLPNETVIFHAATGNDEAGRYIVAGGRVLGITAKGSSLEEALRKCYERAGQIFWEGMQYRKDIGK